jgi:hypothetical protein
MDTHGSLDPEQALAEALVESLEAEESIVALDASVVLEVHVAGDEHTPDYLEQVPTSTPLITNGPPPPSPTPVDASERIITLTADDDDSVRDLGDVEQLGAQLSRDHPLSPQLCPSRKSISMHFLLFSNSYYMITKE